jgi:tetratricopeptide (TPR) repeat protein
MLNHIIQSTTFRYTIVVAFGTVTFLLAHSPSAGQIQNNDSAELTQKLAIEDDTDDPKPTLQSATEQKRLVQEIYETTKTAKSAKQLSGMLQKCDAAIKAGLNKKRHDYVRTLKAWALNRRGESRLEVAKQLKAIGNVAQYQKAFDEAISDFNDSLSIDTTRHRTFNSRGIAYLFDNQLVLAAKDFTKAVGKKADFAAGYFNRAEALSSMKKFDLALKDYETVLRLEPNDAQAITGRAHANLELGNLDLAMKDYDRIVAEYDNNPIALVNRGDCHQKAANWKACLADYRAAKKIASENLASENLASQRIAWVLATASNAQFRDAEQALQLIKKCMQTAHQPTVAMLETLAAAQASAGQFEQAQQSQSKAIQLTGGSTDSTTPSKVKTAVGDDVAAPTTAAQVRMALYEDKKPYLQNEKK